MEKIKVSLGAVQETLLIPLLSRALLTKQATGFIHDPRAVEIVEQLDYDFSKWEKSASSSMFMGGLRTRMLDNYVKEFLALHPQGTVVEIGCGLNTRFDRVDNGQVRWFDLDLPDSMALRQQFFTNNDRQTMIPASVLDTDWITQVQETGGPYCFVCEAVLIYLENADAERAIKQIVTAFPEAWLLTDTISGKLIKKQANSDVMKHLTKESWFRWQVDNPKELERLGMQLKTSRSYADADPELLKYIPKWMSFTTRVAPWLARFITKGYYLNRYLINKV